MTEVAVVLVLIFFVLLLCNVPVAVAIGTASLAAVYANGGMGAPERIVADRMVSGVSSFSLLAIPFFVLSGILMGRGRLSAAFREDLPRSTRCRACCAVRFPDRRQRRSRASEGSCSRRWSGTDTRRSSVWR